MVDREPTISRRDLIIAGGLTVFAAALEAGHARAVDVWNRTVDSSPLGDKFKQDLQSLDQLKNQYNRGGTPYKQRVQISDKYNAQEKIVTEMAEDIGKTIDPSKANNFPHFKWWKSGSPAYLGLGLGVVGIYGIINSLKENLGRRRQPQEPQTT